MGQHRTKFSRPGHLATGVYTPWFKSPLSYVKRFWTEWRADEGTVFRLIWSRINLHFLIQSYYLSGQPHDLRSVVLLTQRTVGSWVPVACTYARPSCPVVYNLCDELIHRPRNSKKNIWKILTFGTDSWFEEAGPNKNKFLRGSTKCGV